MENKEIWKDVPGYEGRYKISESGIVKSIKFKEKIIKPFLSNGYLRVALSKDAKKTKITIHQLVAMAFLGHVPCGLERVVDHIDNCKINNHVSNIQVVTQRINATKDRVRGVSKYRGVSWCKRSKKWKAAAYIDDEKIALGQYDSELDARDAYIKAVRDWDKYKIKRKKKIKSSKYKRVSFKQENQKWKATYIFKGERFHLGYYKTEEEAYLATLQAKERVPKKYQ